MPHTVPSLCPSLRPHLLSLSIFLPHPSCPLPVPMQNAEQQGPEHATKHVWVVKPALRERFGLPADLPAEIQEQLAASVKPPKKSKKQLGELGELC